MAVWPKRPPIVHRNTRTYSGRCDMNSFFVGLFAVAGFKFCGSVFVELWFKKKHNKRQFKDNCCGKIYASRISKILVNCVSGIYKPCGDQSIQCHHGIRVFNAI